MMMVMITTLPRFVPFGPQQANMAMMATLRPSTARPLQVLHKVFFVDFKIPHRIFEVKYSKVNYQLDNALNSFIRLSTRPPPRCHSIMMRRITIRVENYSG